VYYIGGIAETAIGKAAPWFILAVMLFAYAVRSLYMESCGLFVRGGVYRVVKQAETAIFGNRLGGITAKLSVSALMFDYVLTGPISAVSAGLYLVGLINTLLPYGHVAWHLPSNIFAMLFAIGVTLFFWWENIKGVPESSGKALKIMIATTVMGVLVIAWSLVTLAHRGFQWPPFTPSFGPESWGWLGKFKGAIKPLGALGIAMAFGHTLLAMSGEESLAQVYRELEAPKLKNLKRTGFVIFLYCMLLTSLVSFFAVMIIPDSVRLSQYSDNLISGLTMYFVGPHALRLAFQAFVVFVGFLILAGAVNTSIVGSNGVLARVGEDGVLPDFMRKPHPRFGTSYRLINLTVGLQIVTLLLCRGDVYMLGEAYAFGVIWSFVFKAMAIIVLRFYDKTPREYKVPGNIRIGRHEIPLGLFMIFAILFVTACVNLLTKRIATISGSIFTLSFFTIFTISEQINKRRLGHQPLSGQGLTENGHIDPVNLRKVDLLSPQALGIAGHHRMVVAVRDPRNLAHLKKILNEIGRNRSEVVVMTSKVAQSYQLEGDLSKPSQEEEVLFTQIIAVAEKAGHSVIPVMVPSNDPFYAMAQTTHDLQAQELVVGKSGKWTPEVQMEQIALAWGAVREPQARPLRVRIIWDGSEYREDL
jgi:amino acid transporter